MSLPAVTNSTCLIILDRIGRLDLLRKVFPAVYSPPAVRAEFGIETDWLKVQPVRNTPLVKALGTQIGVGEAEAIALAQEMGDVFVVLDDKKARRLAKQLGL